MLWKKKCWKPPKTIFSACLNPGWQEAKSIPSPRLSSLDVKADWKCDGWEFQPRGDSSFSFNIRPPRPAGLPLSTRQGRSTNELVTRALKGSESCQGVVVGIWKASRFVTQRFAAVPNCSWHRRNNRCWQRKKKEEEEREKKKQKSTNQRVFLRFMTGYKAGNGSENVKSLLSGRYGGWVVSAVALKPFRDRSCHSFHTSLTGEFNFYWIDPSLWLKWCFCRLTFG